MHVLAFLVFVIFGGRLIRALFRFFGRSLQDQDRNNYYRNDQQSRNDQQAQQSAEEAQEAYRRWQEEIYRRYRESQNQYQNQGQNQYQNQYGGQQSYQQYGRYGQGAYGYQTPRPNVRDPKLDEVRRMYGHPATLDELDDRQRELRKKYHPDNNNGDASMFILVDQVHDELERTLR